MHWADNFTKGVCNFIDRYFLIVLMTILGVCFVASGVMFYTRLTATHFSLNVNEWKCTATKPVTTTFYIQVGKVLMPQQVTTDECIEYKRNY